MVKRQIIEIDVDRIHPNLRLIYSRESIDRLCRFVKSGGEVEPLEVWFDGECFRIWDGEKRWRVCKALGIHRVKVFLVAFNEITGEMEQQNTGMRNTGIMEYWNNGKLEKTSR